MTNISIKQTWYQLLNDLGINNIYVGKDKLKIVYTRLNQKIVAFGQTEEEVIENFYYLYQELINPAWKIL